MIGLINEWLSRYLGIGFTQPLCYECGGNMELVCTSGPGDREYQCMDCGLAYWIDDDGFLIV